MSLPNTMSVIVAPVPGGPEALRVEQRPLPELGPGEILVRVHVAGINRADIFQRQGKYPPPRGASDVLGLEIAGEVVAAGAGASRFAEGDAVMALVAGGGYAEYCKVHETNALAIPAGMSMAEAGGTPEAAFTVWSNLFARVHLAAGETVLIHGGTSGIGTMAIQLAKIFGTRVLTTAGSPEKCATCRKLGADVAIDYRSEDFVERARATTDGRGPDVILDIVGGPYVVRNYKAAAEDGRIVQVSTQSGGRAETDFHLMMSKRLIHTGSTLRPRSIAFKGELAAAVERNVVPLLASRRLVTVVDSTFPFREAAAAHARMDAPDHIGKTVLTFV
jgi:NADPH2:quinone reductase